MRKKKKGKHGELFLARRNAVFAEKEDAEKKGGRATRHLAFLRHQDQRWRAPAFLVSNGRHHQTETNSRKKEELICEKHIGF